MARPALLTLFFLIFAVFSYPTQAATHTPPLPDKTPMEPKPDTQVGKSAPQPIERRITRSSTRGSTKYPPSKLLIEPKPAVPRSRVSKPRTKPKSVSQDSSLIEPKKTTQSSRTRASVKTKRLPRATVTRNHSNSPELLVTKAIPAILVQDIPILDGSTPNPLPSPPRAVSSGMMHNPVASGNHMSRSPVSPYNPTLTSQTTYSGMMYNPIASGNYMSSLPASPYNLAPIPQVGFPVMPHGPNLASSNPLRSTLLSSSNAPTLAPQVIVRAPLYRPSPVTSGNFTNNYMPSPSISPCTHTSILQAVFPGMMHGSSSAISNSFISTLNSSSSGPTLLPQVVVSEPAHRQSPSTASSLANSPHLSPNPQTDIPKPTYEPNSATSSLLASSPQLSPNDPDSVIIDDSASMSTSALPLLPYKVSGHTAFDSKDITNGKLIFATGYSVVFHSGQGHVAILVISKLFSSLTKILDAVYSEGLIKTHNKFPEFGLSGMVIRFSNTINIQHLPGPLRFTMNGVTVFTTEFNGPVGDFTKISANDATGDIHTSVRKDRTFVQSLFTGEQEIHSQQSMQNLRLKVPQQQTVRIPTWQYKPISTPREQPILNVANDFSNIPYSYKATTQLQVSERMDGLLFSGQEHKILLTSAGKGVAVLFMQGENSDAISILNTVLTAGLKAAASQIMGLSGILIKEQSPRVVEFVEGPLSVSVGGKALTSSTLPESLQEYEMTDSYDKFHLVLTRTEKAI